MGGVDEVRRRLAALGVGADEIEHAIATEDYGLVSNLRLLGRAELSAQQLAEELGVEVSDLRESYRRLGVRIDDPDAVLFQRSEVELMRLLRVATDDLFTDDEGGDILRVVASGFERIADTAVNEFAAGVEGRATAEVDDALTVIDLQTTSGDLGLAFSDLAGPVLAHHFRQAAERQRLSMRAAEVPKLSRYAVGFADIAGYTARSVHLEPDALSAFVRDFEVAAFDLADELGARVVKHIGDEVMFAAMEAGAACRLATALVEHFVDDGIGARGGVAFGDVLTRRGDYHGPIVNTASRLADEAVDGEVLVDEGVARAVEGTIPLEPAGRRRLKGFASPVRAWSLPPSSMA